MPCAAERAIESSRYASKHVWDLVSPAPDYSDTDLRIVAGFLKWSTERLAPHSIQIHNGGIMFMDIIRPASTAFGHLKALHDAEGATPNYRAAWKDFYDTFIRRFLGFVEFQDLLHADFLAVYQHLKSVPSVQELDIKTCAIVWKGYYQGWMNLDGWQKLVVFYQAYFPLKRHMDRLYPVAHSLARDVYSPEKREEGERRSAAVWQDEMRRKWA